MEKLKELLYDIDKDRTNLGRIHGLIIQYAAETENRLITKNTGNWMTETSDR